MQKLWDELEGLYSKLVALNKKITEMEQANSTLQNEVQALTLERDKFLNEAEMLRKEVDKYMREAEMLRKQIEQMQAKNGNGNGHK